MFRLPLQCERVSELCPLFDRVVVMVVLAPCTAFLSLLLPESTAFGLEFGASNFPFASTPWRRTEAG